MTILNQVLPPYPTREESLAYLSRAKGHDLVIIGGGIHGATLAHVAALNGLKCVLLERDDYASATSSRSSKMAHGGLRYLEQFDFHQVYEGIKTREELYINAEQLVKPHPFLIPVFEGQNWFRAKLELGLTIYDLMSLNKKRWHSWKRSEEVECQLFKDHPQKLVGCFQYWDGILNDTRLVIDRIVAARQEGAFCLNHAEVLDIHNLNSGKVLTHWKDKLTGKINEIESGIVVNCAGPWVTYRGLKEDPALKTRVVYSQGTHLLFSKPWPYPALFLPMPEAGRYYFVWPHFAGTLVGTTERDIETLELDPQPTKDEINEILVRIAKDLPNAGLDKKTLFHAFAGVRTLPLRSSHGPRSQLSRKHIWHYDRGVLSLLGGKLTSATWTAEEGLRKIFELADIKSIPVSLKKRKLPGSEFLEQVKLEFRTEAKARAIPTAITEHAIRKFGSRLYYILTSEDLTSDRERMFEVVGDTVLRGEIEIAKRIEQAETVQDLMRRRLDLEYFPGAALPALEAIVSVFAEGKNITTSDLNEQIQSYKKRITSISELLS